ncbi:unnamed protein product [Durusdinium trenchii]|uniref:Peptidase C14 caspase domain-containing protein n=1 Tax=Durusdinium trenchii TaxID=1381693 RepID=A0ABP0R1Y7_9DINO
MLQSRCRRSLLSIGIQDYAFRPLRHATKDAEILAFKFQTRNYRTQIACNLPDRDSINQAIDEFSSSCIEDATELIVVYFAGYAVATDRGRVQLQLQKAAHADDVEAAHCIGVGDLLERMLRLKRRPRCFTLAILDCGHSHVELGAQEASTQHLPLNGRWATLWSTGAQEPQLVEAGYGHLVCSILHHMVMDPELELHEVTGRLHQHVMCSTDAQSVQIFGSTEHAPLIFSHEVWRPESLALSTIGRLRSTSSVTVRRSLSACCSRLSAQCQGCSRHRLLYALYGLLAIGILVLLVVVAIRSRSVSQLSFVSLRAARLVVTHEGSSKNPLRSSAPLRG